MKQYKKYDQHGDTCMLSLQFFVQHLWNDLNLYRKTYKRHTKYVPISSSVNKPFLDVHNTFIFCRVAVEKFL